MKTIFYKNSIWIFLTLLVFSFSCEKENSLPIGDKNKSSIEYEEEPTTENENDGFALVTFTGLDKSVQICSGGYFFTFEDVGYRALEVVENSILTDFTQFPKTYLVKFDQPTDGCYNIMTNLVRVKEIREA